MVGVLEMDLKGNRERVWLGHLLEKCSYDSLCRWLHQRVLLLDDVVSC